LPNVWSKFRDHLRFVAGLPIVENLLASVCWLRIFRPAIQGLQDLAEVFGIADVVRPPK
jgi:hypothetical protein